MAVWPTRLSTTTRAAPQCFLVASQIWERRRYEIDSVKTHTLKNSLGIDKASDQRGSPAIMSPRMDQVSVVMMPPLASQNRSEKGGHDPNLLRIVNTTATEG